MRPTTPARRPIVTDETIDLVASGYEWECPFCATLNEEIETRSTVVCRKCNRQYDVDEAFHAEG